MTYETTDGKVVTEEELEDICIIYVRNLVLGFNRTDIVTLPVLKRWLEIDRRLKATPPDAVLMSWLTKWTPTYLAAYSYEHDYKPESN